ncbi:hypothetical protein NC653_005101 [Populus alba x Populus x berolinensis]|uniref:Uncharacterized protein n=1 Tax=Populus alba x Populus x berolinensis TaxID=444605 RepID=A0AAD6WAT6_9ROSI|nr:hypothetical protein NC653_005101 [Populus alba x Populus x berolinensis]
MDVLIGTSKASCHVRSIRLSGLLKSLYESVDDFLQLPLTYQAISNVQHQGSVDEVLDRSLRLLEVCGATKDIFSQMKECLKDLESSILRKRGESSLAGDVEAFMISLENN